MKKISNKALWLCLLAGTIAFTFTSGVWSIPVMAWVFPACFLTVTRNSRPVRGLLLVAAAIFVGGFLKWPGYLQLGTAMDNLIAAVLALITLLPFIFDRIFYPMFIRGRGPAGRFVGSLIFPAAFASLEMLMNYFPMGSTVAITLTQVENLPFIQTASLLGQFGLCFLIAWFGSAVYFLIDFLVSEKSKSLKSLWPSLKKPVCILLAVYLAVYTFGGARIILAQPEGDMVKVALGQGPEISLVDGEWLNADLPTNLAQAELEIDQAAAGGASLILFNEEAFCIGSAEEAEMKALLSDRARDNGIYVVAGLEVYDENEELLSDNKITCVSPEGAELFDYTKTILVPFVERGYYKVGDGNVRTIDMTLGDSTCKVSSVICYEGDFTRYINKIPADTDIHLNPSWEWEGLGDFHNHALILRGVENGFSVLKATYESEVTASDYYGRCRSYSNPDATGYDAVSFAYVPAEGVTTVYGLLGSVIDWSYVAFAAVLAIAALANKKKENVKKA